MSRFSRSEAESKGWVIVHEDENQAHYRAENYIDGVKVEASGVSEGKLLEAINAHHAHLDSFLPVEDARVDDSGMPLDEDGNLVRTVQAADGEELTEAEWSHRGGGDAIYEDGDMHIFGASAAAAEADDARQAIAQEKENLRTQEPDVGPVENLDEESRDGDLQDRLIVRKGEESMSDVVARKMEESANLEAERSAAGVGIGPMDLDEDGNVVPPGGKSELFDPSDLPGGISSSEEVVQARQDAEEDKALELRDEHGKQADKPELAGQVAEAGSEAQQKLADDGGEDRSGDGEEGVPVEAAENVANVVEPDIPGEPDQESAEAAKKAVAEKEEAQPDSDDEDAPEATPAAEEAAKEHGVDLSQVEGSGKDGKILKSDVEEAASAPENDPED